VRTVGIVVAILVVLLVVALVVLGAQRNRRRALLRERFGPEYDVAVRHGQDRRAVEQRLAALAERRETLDIRDVDLQEHERFAQRWVDAQGGFVDDPGQAVADADGLVNGVLRSRGYPVENFDDRAALVATDHQDVVERYRSAHETYAEHLRTGSADTEQLRQAFLAYREVFQRLNQPAPDQASQQAPEQAPEEAPQPAPEQAAERAATATDRPQQPQLIQQAESPPSGDE
jgi:hypothetical protein